MNIAISQRIDKIDEYNEFRDSIDQRMVDWIIESGFKPILVPNSLIKINKPLDKQKTLKNWIEDCNISGIVLSGGNNIGDMPKRDLTESFLLSWAEKNNIPVLGICRGMQMMGIYDNGSLKKVDGHTNTFHNIVFKENFEFPNKVNSYHDFSLSSCPKSFKIIAHSEDGNIEAILHKDLSWEGWMWHPERDEEFSELNKERLKKVMGLKNK